VDRTRLVYEYAFDPSSDWVGDWGDATLDGIEEITADPIENAVERWESMKGRRTFHPMRWRVRCHTPACRREYRGVTWQLVQIVDAAVEMGQRSVRLEPDMSAVASRRPVDLSGD
jgi:hypothetical protein